MNALLTPIAVYQPQLPMAEQNQRITETIKREQKRLANFIRQRVADSGEAEDILQQVLFEFVAAYRLPKTIEQAGAWLFQVARNRIIDRFRKKREVSLPQTHEADDEADYWLESALPALDNDPETIYMRAMLLAAISTALDELPEKQRNIFIAHELDGCSFNELVIASGENKNTLLGWKRQAVLHLRSKLQPFYDEFY